MGVVDVGGYVHHQLASRNLSSWRFIQDVSGLSFKLRTSPSADETSGEFSTCYHTYIRTAPHSLVVPAAIGVLRHSRVCIVLK